VGGGEGKGSQLSTVNGTKEKEGLQEKFLTRPSKKKKDTDGKHTFYRGNNLLPGNPVGTKVQEVSTCKGITKGGVVQVFKISMKKKKRGKGLTAREN